MVLPQLLNKLLSGDLTNLNQTFFEAIIPPADVYWIDGNVQVKVDLAGFDGEDIDAFLEGNILRIEATRKSTKDNMQAKNKKIKYFMDHRPLVIDASIPLPFNPFDEKSKNAQINDKVSYVNGVLTLDIINLPKRIVISTKK